MLVHLEDGLGRRAKSERLQWLMYADVSFGRHVVGGGQIIEKEVIGFPNVRRMYMHCRGFPASAFRATDCPLAVYQE